MRENAREFQASRRILSRRDLVGLAAGCGCAFLASSLLPGRAKADRASYCVGGTSGSTASNFVSLTDYQRSDRNLPTYIMIENDFLKSFYGKRMKTFIDVGGDGAYVDIAEHFIAIGTKFADDIASGEYGALRLSGVLAHENAHGFQMRSGADLMMTDENGFAVKYVELHADYLAGSYMRWREQHMQGAPGKLAEMFFRLGDRAVSSSTHHGTQEERLDAFKNGYTDFKRLQKQGKGDVQTAAARGFKYVRSMLGA